MAVDWLVAVCLVVIIWGGKAVVWRTACYNGRAVEEVNVAGVVSRSGWG